MEQIGRSRGETPFYGGVERYPTGGSDLGTLVGLDPRAPAPLPTGTGRLVPTRNLHSIRIEGEGVRNRRRDR